MYKRVGTRWMKHLDFILMDILCVQLSFVLAFCIRHGWENPYARPEYARFAILLCLVQLVVGFLISNYHGILRRGHLLELRSVIIYTTLVVACMIMTLFLVKQSAVYSRKVLVYFWIISTVIVWGGRTLHKLVVINRPANDKYQRQILLIDSKNNVDKTLKSLSNNPHPEDNIAGLVLVDSNETGKKYKGIPIVCEIEGLLDYINTNTIDGVFVTTQGMSGYTELMFETCIDMGIVVRTEIHGFDANVGQQSVERFGGSHVIATSMSVMTTRQAFMKRCLDLCGGIVGSIIAVLIIIVVTPIIKIQSPGPVIFKQKRIGLNGRVFTIYKIRTMYTDAEERKKELMEQNKMQGLMFKVDNDPRIYPAGHFFRKTSLDEFPQFFNVLKGDMAIVGTRPPTLDEYERYEYRHQKRMSIKPGITGLWQVSGRSEITDFEEIVKLDAEYITNWRLLSDVKIIWQTIGVVIHRKGAE